MVHLTAGRRKKVLPFVDPDAELMKAAAGAMKKASGRRAAARAGGGPEQQPVRTRSLTARSPARAGTSDQRSRSMVATES